MDVPDSTVFVTREHGFVTVTRAIVVTTAPFPHVTLDATNQMDIASTEPASVGLATRGTRAKKQSVQTIALVMDFVTQIKLYAHVKLGGAAQTVGRRHAMVS